MLPLRLIFGMGVSKNARRDRLNGSFTMLKIVPIFCTVEGLGDGVGGGEMQAPEHGDGLGKGARLGERRSLGKNYLCGAGRPVVYRRRWSWQNELKGRRLSVIGNLDQLLYIEYDNFPAPRHYYTFFLKLRQHPDDVFPCGADQAG